MIGWLRERFGEPETQPPAIDPWTPPALLGAGATIKRLRPYGDIVELSETISRRRANALLEAGYELIDIGIITIAGVDKKSGRDAIWRRHEYVFGRMEGQLPFGKVLDAIAERDARERAAAEERAS